MAKLNMAYLSSLIKTPSKTAVVLIAGVTSGSLLRAEKFRFFV